MSFLNPWFWLGLAALGAPLWLHLRRRPQTNVLRFSTLRFLEDCPRPQQSPRRLEQLLLLVLRLLGIAFIIAAFAWPYLPVAERTPVEESRVYILDNSLSRQADPAWITQRDRIIRDLQQLSPRVQAAVILLANQPRVLASFGDDPAQALETLRQLRPSFQRGSYLAALRQAKSLLDNSLGARKQILMFTDNQENQWTEQGQSPPFLSGIEISLPLNPKTNAPNLFLSEPRATRVFLGERSVVDFTAKLSRTGPATEANVLLTANHQVIFNRSIDLKDQPAALTLSAEWEANPNAWLQGEISIDGQPDALPADNRVFFSLPPVREGELAVLVQSDYLRLALSQEVMRGRWHSVFLDPTRLDTETAAPHGDVLMIESAYLQSAGARQLVSRYLSNRRGVFLLVNRLSPAVQGALRELGFAPRSTEAKLAPPRTPFHFQYLQGRHPILHPFLAGDFGQLLEVEVQQYFALESNEAFPLILGDQGQGLLFQSARFAGTLMVLAFGLDRRETSWPIHPTFIPFLDLCLQNARPREAGNLDYQPGDVATLTLPNTITEVTFPLLNGQSSSVGVAGGKVRLSLPDQPGLYPITGPDAASPEQIIAINPSPKESVLNYDNQPEALEFWRDGAPPKQAARFGAMLAEPPNLRGILNQRLWWWFLIAGLGALVVEQIWTMVKRAT